MATRVESVRFNGIIYRRYPDAKQHSDRVYYTAGIGDRQRGYKRLHEDIWRAVNGDIPSGHHIHHRDHNPDNNDPSNLVCLTADDHADYHASDQRGKCSDGQAALLERIRPLAAAWHSTSEGLAWHSANGYAAWAQRTAQQLACQQCGNSYETKSMHGAERFCSNACKSAWRRSTSLDDEDRNCACCGSNFRVNRYKRTQFCGRSCSVKHAARKSCACPR